MWTTNLLPPANKVWDKVMFSQVFSVHMGGGLASQYASQVTWSRIEIYIWGGWGVIPGGLPPGGFTSRGSASGEGSWADFPPQDTWDTVNMRAVRILLECILVLISNYILIASPLLKSKLPSFLRSQVNQEVTLTDVARYLLLQTERDMTWTFEWIGIDGETFNDEHDQMSGALVWL